MALASSSIIIDVEPSKLFDVITDFEKYPEFLKEVSDIKMVDQGENQWTVTFYVSIIKKVDYTLKLKGDPGKSVTWSLAKKGFMKQNDGSWQLKDLGNGKTKATYTTEVNLGLLAPKSVVNMLVSTSFPAMLKAFKKRAENL